MCLGLGIENIHLAWERIAHCTTLNDAKTINNLLYFCFSLSSSVLFGSVQLSSRSAIVFGSISIYWILPHRWQILVYNTPANGIILFHMSISVQWRRKRRKLRQSSFFFFFLRRFIIFSVLLLFYRNAKHIWNWNGMTTQRPWQTIESINKIFIFVCSSIEIRNSLFDFQLRSIFHKKIVQLCDVIVLSFKLWW